MIGEQANEPLVGGYTTARLPAPDLSVVVPAFNESKRLGRSLQQILQYVDHAARTAEILVVDDGSTDDTGAIASESLSGRRGRVLSNGRNRGKGFAVRRGVLEATGRTVLITDADLSCPIEEHASLARLMEQSALDIVIGSRSLPDSRVEVHQHRGRETMGKAFNVFVRALTALPYLDTQCGFKLVDRARTRELFERLSVHGFAYDVELLVLATDAGLRIGEVPVVWRNSRDSRVSLVGDSSRMLFDLVRLSMHRTRRRDPARSARI
jgi:dolichyl-phosphate beta-glucosyltransferase